MLLEELLAGHPAAAVRLMILDRPWQRAGTTSRGCSTRPQRRLEGLYRAAGRTAASDPAAVDELRRLLATELDVPAALDLAIRTSVGPPAHWPASSASADGGPCPLGNRLTRHISAKTAVPGVTHAHNA